MEMGQGGGGGENSPSTQETEGESTTPGIRMEIVRQGPTVQPPLQKDKAERDIEGGDKEEESSMKAADSTDAVSARPEHGPSTAQAASTASWHRNVQ